MYLTYKQFNLLMACLVLAELYGAKLIWYEMPPLIVMIMSLCLIGVTCDAWHKMQRRAGR